MRLKNKVAIVTGGGSGIGMETAKLFGHEGAQVVVADYNVNLGNKTVQFIQETGHKACFFQVDVVMFEQIHKMVQFALNKFGGIDILFNSAGILQFGTVLNTDEETWNRVISINLTGTFLSSKAVLPHMMKRGGGSIINITSSVGAHAAMANTVAYAVSKAGVALLTKAMAIDHAKDNIRVNAIAPGPIDTNMLRENLSKNELKAFQNTFPMKRMGKPEEIAYTALFLASDEASFLTGSVIAVDGGQTAEV